MNTLHLLLLIFLMTAFGRASSDEFSTKLRQQVDDLLGTEEFQVCTI